MPPVTGERRRKTDTHVVQLDHETWECGREASGKKNPASFFRMLINRGLRQLAASPRPAVVTKPPPKPAPLPPKRRDTIYEDVGRRRRYASNTWTLSVERNAGMNRRRERDNIVLQLRDPNGRIRFLVPYDTLVPYLEDWLDYHRGNQEEMYWIDVDQLLADGAPGVVVK